MDSEPDGEDASNFHRDMKPQVVNVETDDTEEVE